MIARLQRVAAAVIVTLVLAACSDASKPAGGSATTPVTVPSSAALSAELLTPTDLGPGWTAVPTRSDSGVTGCLGGMSDGSLPGASAYVSGAWQSNAEFPAVVEMLVQVGASSAHDAFAKKQADFSTCRIVATVSGVATQIQPTPIALTAVGDESAAFEASASGYSMTLDLVRKGSTLALIVYVNDAAPAMFDVQRVVNAAVAHLG